MSSEIIKFYDKYPENFIETIIKNSVKNLTDEKLIIQTTNHIKRIYCNNFIKIDWFKITNLRKWDFINKSLKAIKKDKPKYLEIGAFRNENFNKINTTNKISVDPDPKSFPTFIGTSNEFFRNNSEKFDVIFIDGLHTFEQCRIDAINALECLNTNGYLFLHDLVPRNFIEEYIPCITGIWTGDVWKVSVELSKTKGVKFSVILADHGLGMLQKINDDVKYFNNDEIKLRNSSFKDFFELNKSVNYQNSENAFNKIK